MPTAKRLRRVERLEERALEAADRRALRENLVRRLAFKPPAEVVLGNEAASPLWAYVLHAEDVDHLRHIARQVVAEVSALASDEADDRVRRVKARFEV